MSDSSLALESRSEVEDDPKSEANFYLQQLKLAEDEDKDYVTRGRKIVQRYRDERPETSKSIKFNVLWSNVETLKPILYARTPKPDVQQRNRNGEAPARLGAMILERSLVYTDDLDEFDEVMDRVVEDRLLPGRGVARIYYEPEYGEEEEDPDAELDDKGERPMYRPLDYERARLSYVFWEDYRESPARTWHEVWWVAYRSYMTRDELVKRFGDEIGKAVTLDYAPKDSEEGGPQGDAFKKAQVWELWDKSKKQVVWIAPSYSEKLLDTQDDPLKLPGFFPSPCPLAATTTNETNIPVADYSEYQDQAIELDVLTTRIDRLQSSLAVKGIYAGTLKSDIERLARSGENEMIPVEDWAAWADKGGMPGAIAWFPMEQIAKVLLQLYDSRDRVLRTLYQITGMADILRGETNPNETLGAQQLKSQFATRRISRAQKQVARFARDLMRLRGHCIATHFSPETLSLMSGLPEPMPPLPPQPPQVIPMPPQQQQAQPGQNVVPHPAMGQQVA